MTFICSLLDPIEGEPVSFEVNKAKKLSGRWLEMFNDIGEVYLIVSPTPAGVYTLERIK